MLWSGLGLKYPGACLSDFTEVSSASLVLVKFCLQIAEWNFLRN